MDKIEIPLKNGEIVVPKVFYTIAKDNPASELVIKKLQELHKNKTDYQFSIFETENEIKSVDRVNSVAIYDGKPRNKKGGVQYFTGIAGSVSGNPCWVKSFWSVRVNTERKSDSRILVCVNQIISWFVKNFVKNLEDKKLPWGDAKKNKKIVAFDDSKVDDVNFHVVLNRINFYDKDCRSIKLSEIKSLTQKGVIVRALTHIGNMPSRVSIYPKIGITITDYFANQSVVDKNNRPECVITNGIPKKIFSGNEPVLSPYLDAAEVFGNSKIRNLSFFHHEQKKLALKYSSVELEDSLLDYGFIPRALEVLLKNEAYILNGYKPSLFCRYVDETGKVFDLEAPESYDPKDYIDFKKYHADAIRNNYVAKKAGFIPIKEMTIILDALTNCYEQINKGFIGKRSYVCEVYSVSGSQMVNYLKSLEIQGVLDRMYKILKNEFDWLPSHICYFVLPFGFLKFIPSSGEKQLERIVLDLCSLYENKKDLNKSLDVFFGESRNEILKQIKTLSTKISETKQNFVDIHKKRRGFTQHDLVNGETVSDEILEKLLPMSFAEIEDLFRC